MAGLVVNGISKTYGTKKVVDNISFKAEPGQILGILGPNGAGKTTAIRMIMGITAPDSGSISYSHDGRELAGIPKSLVGYLPEERGLYKEARVIEILTFLAGLKNISKKIAREIGMTWLTKFDLQDYAKAKVEQLSKGMAQKVQFIASVIHEPKFVVLDEPFSGLDPVSQEIFKTEIRALADRGATVLLSSHQMNIVEELCDKLFLIHKGKHVFYGTLPEIKELHGNYRVNILSDDDLTSLESLDYVENVSKIGGLNWVLTLKDGTKANEFLVNLPSTISVQELNISRLSLHEIFVKIAQGGLDDEGNLEDSYLGNNEKSTK